MQKRSYLGQGRGAAALKHPAASDLQYWQESRRSGRRRDGIAAAVCAVLLAAATARADTPTVTRAESRLLDQVALLAQTNAPAALRLLEAERRATRAGAALDYTAGNLYSSLSDDAAAVEAYRSALDKHPGFTAAQAALGRALAARGDWIESERILHPLTQPSDAGRDILLLYGHVLLELDRVIGAELIYRRLLQAEGDTPEALYGLVRGYLRQERLLEGTAIMENLVRQQPGDAAAWALLADLWLRRERPDLALARLETARRLEAVTPPMLAQLGDLYVNQGLPSAAAEVYQAALQLSSEPEALLLRAAEGLLMAGDTPRAGELLDRYRAGVATPEPRYDRIRARWAERTGRFEAARDAYRDWIQRDPLNLDALLSLGDRYLADGDPGSASLWYERARDAHPQQAAPLIRLAHLSVGRQAYAEAIDLLERAHVLGDDPETSRASQQIRRLQELATD